MPELPEVETVRRGLMPVMEGRRIERVEQRRPDLRFPFPDRFVERLTGARIEALGRRAKYLQAELSTGQVLVMHLGMSGSFRIDETLEGRYHHQHSRLAAHDHVVFTLEGDRRVTYNDPRRFGFMLLIPKIALAEHPLFAGLGLEPLGNAVSGATLGALFEGKKTSLKAALLDQRLISGLGNIYVCEALFRAGLRPDRPAGTLAGAKGKVFARRLADAIGTVLRDAIEAGGSSLRDHRQTNGDLGLFQHRFDVYDRAGEPCRRPGCVGVIERVVQSNRSSFFCATCQA